jgi:hypothetical protein
MPTASISNQPLAKPFRSQLESTVKSARDVAEKAALAALQQLAVSEAKAPDYLSDELNALRRRLRAHGRALGDVKAKDDTQGLRLNIRPFMTAEVLRHNKKPKLNIIWDKGRGKDVDSAPWFKVFKGDRINDHHLTVTEKRSSPGLAGRG